MNYNENYNKNQYKNSEKINWLYIPTLLERFVNTNTKIETINKSEVVCFYGYVILSDDDLRCDCCGNKMHIHNSYDIYLKHLPFGANHSIIKINKKQLECPHCGFTKVQEIPFKEEKHAITNELKNYICDLLKTNKFTNKDIANIVGTNQNVVKDIDLERLRKIYTLDGNGKKLIRPERQARYLGIDEFKLHNGYKYATHIIDYDTGHILWISEGKKKQVVYDFINHVGLNWMQNVVAVACDMNSDFEEAFKESCPHIKIVYDYFHIVKNFNDKVINKVRIDEEKRLIKEGNKEAAKKLKRTKFILTSNFNTLKKEDMEAENSKIISKGSEVFKKQEIKRKGGKVNKYNELINNNELFLNIELIKDILAEAYRCNDEETMAKLIFDIMELCEESNNEYFLWFKKLLYNHFDGIISHATIKISSGKIEGINNKIKTIRRQSYGYPDDEYFFYKIMDASRH